MNIRKQPTNKVLFKEVRKNMFASFTRPLTAVAAILVLFAIGASAQAGGFKGKIKDQRGKGVAGAQVEVRQDGTVVSSAKSNNKGEFTISGLKAGKYNISFDAPGFATGVLFNVEVGTSVRDLGGRLILAPDQGNIVFIRGAVFFKEGSSVTGAKVDLELVQADGSTKKVETAYTNVSGDFAFRRPPGPGKYKVTARFKGVAGAKEIVVENPAIYRTAITLDISRNDR